MVLMGAVALQLSLGVTCCKDTRETSSLTKEEPSVTIKALCPKHNQFSRDMVKRELRVAIASCHLLLFCELRAAPVVRVASCTLRVERKLRVENSKVRVETKIASCLFLLEKRPLGRIKRYSEVAIQFAAIWWVSFPVGAMQW